jgi:hypothetical protein
MVTDPYEAGIEVTHHNNRAGRDATEILGQ